MGESGERGLEWEFSRERKRIHALHFVNLGTKGTPWIVWEMRIRELEGKEWTTTFTDGSGLDDKASGGFCSNPTNKDRQPDLSGDQYLGIIASRPRYLRADCSSSIKGCSGPLEYE